MDPGNDINQMMVSLSLDTHFSGGPDENLDGLAKKQRDIRSNKRF